MRGAAPGRVLNYDVTRWEGGGEYYYFMQVKSKIRTDLYNLWLIGNVYYLPLANAKYKTKQPYHPPSLPLGV